MAGAGRSRRGASRAPRLASTSARAAAPRPARRTDRTAARRASSRARASACTWTAPRFSRNASAISAKFCMCGPKTIGLPNTAGSRMLWPPRRRGCRRRTRRSRPDRAARARRSCRGRRRRRAARRRSPARSAGRRRQPRRAHPLDLVEALGLARRDDEQRVAPACRAMRWNASSTGSSSPFSVQAAMITGRSWRSGSSAARGRGRDRPAPRSRNLERVELQAAGHRDAARSAPISMIRRADSSLCMQKRSTSASTRRKNRAPAGSAETSATRCGR